MSPDIFLKKYFVGVVLALVSLAAYFQAKGTTQLIGVGLGPDEASLSTITGGTLLPPKPGGLGSSKSAEPILARNPFDSVTGPLNAKPIETMDLSQPDAVVDTKDPLGAPVCEGTRLEIVTESTDPLWSLAAIQGPGEPMSKVRRIGDDVGAKEVAYIGYNWREGSPAVWLAGGSHLCQALLFAKQPPPPAAPPKPAAGAPGPSKVPPAKRAGPSKVPKEIADKIQRVSESEFNVDRVVVDKILENQAELMRSARIVPEQKDGKVVGIRMFGIRPETLLGHLGFQNGDRLETINGFDMTSPEKALEAYARLRTAPGLAVKINRRGKPITVDFKIK